MSKPLAKNQGKSTLSALLNQAQDSIKAVLPKHLTPERMMKMALVAASRTPRLYECTPATVLQSVMRASELGLDCSGTLGQGYLVPYKNNSTKTYECQFIIGYKGMIELAKRGGEVQSIQAHVVYENDVFEYELGLDPKIKHVPTLSSNRGKVIAVYAVAKLKTGELHPEVMLREDVEEIKNRSKASNSGPWATDFREMARKTVVRRIFKYLPASVELTSAIDHDNRTTGLRVDVVQDDRPRADQLMDRLDPKDEAIDVEQSPEPEPDTPRAATEEFSEQARDRAMKAITHCSGVHDMQSTEAEEALLNYSRAKFRVNDLRSLEGLSEGQFELIKLAINDGSVLIHGSQGVADERNK